MFLMLGGNRSICSDELRYLPEGCVFTCLQILGRFPYIVVLGQKLVPVFLLLFPNCIVMLFRRV